MIYSIGDNIICKLGFDTGEVYSSIKRGESGISRHIGTFGVPEPFMASIVDSEAVDYAFSTIISRAKAHSAKYTKFEKMMLLSASKAIDEAGVDPSAENLVFILSTTKGNVDLIGSSDYDEERVLLWKQAQMLSQWFGNPNTPIVISNACISGACAQIAALRKLSSGKYKYAVVTGVETLSKFIVSGFQSFKALSSSECRPFDSARSGLNLGEAAASIVYSASRREDERRGALCLGAIRNDANHISGPSRTAEGLFNALSFLLGDISADEIAFVNAHGTATVYNDEMESIALSRAGLSDVPVNSLKAYFGHTMGAAGVLETIISGKAMGDGTILGSRGFDSSGVSCRINISKEGTDIDNPAVRKYFIKMLSGFGGSNAALLFKKL